MKQVFLNLILNALDAMPGGGGQLDVYTERAGQPPGVRAVFSDSGEGIAPDVLPHIFDRFFRAQREGRKGVGLGLSIARWIAEAHGGRLSVESEVGQGTQFTLWLPTEAVDDSG